MNRFFSAQGTLWICFATVFLLTPLPIAVAHQAHQMACSKTAINAMNADVQSMPDSEAKTTATKELGLAKEMMGNEDTEACGVHMQKAMKAMEE